MLRILNVDHRRTNCWVRLNEICQVSSCFECRICLEALSQIVKKDTKLQGARVSVVANAS